MHRTLHYDVTAQRAQSGCVDFLPKGTPARRQAHSQEVPLQQAAQARCLVSLQLLRISLKRRNSADIASHFYHPT